MITKFLATIIFLSMCAVMPGSFSQKLKDCPSTKGKEGHYKIITQNGPFNLFIQCYKSKGNSMILIKKSKVCKDTYVLDTEIHNDENRRFYRPCIWETPKDLEKAITTKFCIPDQKQKCVPNTSK